MSMTLEEAIVVLEESKRQNEIMRDNPSTFWASYQMADGVKNSEKRVAALDLVLFALRGPTREMVERMRGEWIKKDVYTECSKCEYWYDSPELEDDGDRPAFCQACGAPMTDGAVDMVMRRWKEAVDDE